MKYGNTKAFNNVDMRPRSQVQVRQSTTVLFQNQKGIRQGCILSPSLFNLYSEYIIKTEVGVDMEAGIGKLTLKNKHHNTSR